ncbi:MAG: rhodanese-like domain-containing protein [Candidatus Melainabacteria bacterium]|nr:rhodanese-like domain-containing protein [Candidatus Melainabacteria bacterium]
MTTRAQEVKPLDVFNKISSGEILQIIDVRESDEFNRLRLSSSQSMPLSLLTHNHRFIQPEKDVYLLCRSGKRAHIAAQQLKELGVEKPLVIEGGLNAWQESSLPVEKTGNAVWSIERQVRFVSAILILSGIALSYSLNSNFIILPLFIGLGMLISAVQDTCGMATVLRCAPWNKAKNCSEN